MAHELTMNNGVAEMAYVGDVPWHGLGQRLAAGASMETWLKAAGMEWTIRKAAVRYSADRAGNDVRTDDDHVVLVRSDNGRPLGIVSPDYNIVQPGEVLEFFRDLVEGQGFQLETAGTMFGGRRYWALAKITDAVVAGWDKIGGYLLFTTSADGSFASEARETTVRVVCNNTISMAVAQIPGKHFVKINHRQAFDARAVKAQLSLGAEHFQAFAGLAEQLTKVKVSDAVADDFVLRLLRGASQDETLAAQVTQASVVSGDSFAQLLAAPFIPKDDDETSRRPRGADTILALFDGAGLGSERKGSQGTAWGLVNAVTEYYDHHVTAKSVDHRLQRAWFGSGDKIKVEAMNLAVEQFV